MTKIIAPLAALLLLLGSCAEEPVPCFEYEIYDVYTYGVNFSNCSDLGVEYEWDFGDGETSTEDNPQHHYATPGSYDVRLFVNGEKKTAELTKTVEIPEPVSIRAVTTSNSAEYKDNVTFSISAFAQNGISSIVCTHQYGDVKEVLLDSAYGASEFTSKFDLETKVPFVYREKSIYQFSVTDENFEERVVAVDLYSENTVDTTEGRVLTKTRDEEDPFELTYQYATGFYNSNTEVLNLSFFDEDGDYIKIEKARGANGEMKGYGITVYDAATGTTHIKETNRVAGSDKMFITDFNKETMTVSGTFEMDVNLDTSFHDVLEVVFDDIRITEIREK